MHERFRQRRARILARPVADQRGEQEQPLQRADGRGHGVERGVAGGEQQPELVRAHVGHEPDRVAPEQPVHAAIGVLVSFQPFLARILYTKDWHDADLFEQFELGFQPVDMLLLAGEDILEQLPRHVIADRLAVLDGITQVRLGAAFEPQIAAEDFLRVLADQQLAEILQVGKALEEQDPLDQLVRMFHLVDGLVVLMLGQPFKAPVPVHARVQKILVDGRQLVLQDLVEVFDYPGVAFHP